jgi:DNA-binding MarR family transcriptional regulator
MPLVYVSVLRNVIARGCGRRKTNGNKMGKKSKDGKKSKSAKKKDHGEYSLADLSPALTQAARSMRTAVSRSLTESGLYAGQDGVILALASEDGLAAGALAHKLGVKAPTMTRTIGRMEAQGFVERRADAEDARLTKVYLTEIGRNSVAQIETSAAACDALATKGFSDKDIRSLVKLLRAIDNNLLGVDLMEEDES